jgi:hypothetical protein
MRVISFTAYYDWGSNLQTPSSIKTAFQSAVGNWNALYSSYIPVYLSQSSSEQLLLNSAYFEGDEAGWVDWDFCILGSVRYYTYAFVNTYNYNSSHFQAIAGHELGHAIGLGHSTATALMGCRRSAIMGHF